MQSSPSLRPLPWVRAGRAAFAGALCLCALGLLGAPAAHAQANLRVLQDATDEVKLEDGSTDLWRFTITYDPASGKTTRTVRDGKGQVVEELDFSEAMVGPTAEELNDAERLIRTDPELAGLLAAARNPIVSGGFPLLREEGHPCDASARCLQFDLMDEDTAARRVDRIRFVVVDMRDGTIVSRDFDVANEGNLARPGADRSR